MTHWIESTELGLFEGIPNNIVSLPFVRRLHVQPIDYLETLSDTQLVSLTRARKDTSALLEEREGWYSLGHRDPDLANYQFVMAHRTPSCGYIERKAPFSESFMLSMAWVVNTPVLFAIGWDDYTRGAFPIAGGGIMTWRPLSEHLEQIQEKWA